ncbi:hypothetical protein [Jannaschia sp. M317]|uniref:hypothetical protein n=1 Tax=Jannaschia sp. M317 TaxID=2867011 RepID=UPI0021A5B454|nr:hypothetical protein [Jannaschia sp. M317]UWQ19197.1 hypothetical protein K3551_07985 [Jannaschia sp. M317]
MRRMNPILLLLAIFALGLPATAQSVTIERDAMIADTRDMPRQNMLRLIDPGVGMIRAMGWRCDSISAARPFLMSRGFTIVCNNFRYTYEFEDRGGNWTVSLG